jgi:3',5'-cyclic AMP phosphodiesterase CpdA
VKSWHPDFILTTGDNNYDRGEYITLNKHIGQYYCDFIYNYDAPEEYRCMGKAHREQVNRFFPSPGNHDAYGPRKLEPYLNYFTLPGNEEYYLFTWGNAAFFSLNSLDGADLEIQKEWLTEALAGSEKAFKVVYFHHPPYSPGPHGDTDDMQWDFHGMGVDVVLCGHDHIYARLENPGEKGLHYIINGLGGKSVYDCSGSKLDPEVTSVICYNRDYGAMRCTLTADCLRMAFFSIGDSTEPVDFIEISK